MLQAINSSAGALNLAASLTGVPFLGAAAMVVQGITQACNDVKVQKSKARQLSIKCEQLLVAINDQASKLEGLELQRILDQVTPVLEKIRRQTSKWSASSALIQFCIALKQNEIKDGLDQCDRSLDSAMNIFHINSSIISHAAQSEMMAMMRSDAAQTKELLFSILSDNSQRRQVVEMQNRGEHVAEQLMEAGQLELRMIGQGHAESNGSDEILLRTSPPPQILNRSQQYLEYQRHLLNLHRETGIPPTIKIMNGEVIKVGELAVAGGTYSDIWMGKWLGDEKAAGFLPIQVALKALRSVRASDTKAKERFVNEIKLWSNLKHAHILPFYGIVTDLGQDMHAVSPWQDNGNVLEYIQVAMSKRYVKSHPDVDRMQLVLGAALGLAYLHSQKIIHGNVKCANVLVSAKGRACICDFGMSKIIEDVTETSASTTLTSGPSVRWLAPELIDGRVPSPTYAADTYSFAMATLELLTGQRPFADCKNNWQVIIFITHHERTPSRPECGWVSDELWRVMQSCWQRDSESRPSMRKVALQVEELVGRMRP